MDATPKLDAQKVTKPIQLLAAWLIGLILVNSAFLVAASRIDGWERSALILAAIFNVPVFLAAMFLLQTKFRPELQEDMFYSKYLSSKTNQVVVKSRFEALDSEMVNLKKTVADAIAAAQAPTAKENTSLLGTVYTIGLNEQLENSEEIRRILRNRAIRLSDIFGENNKKPDGSHMAIDVGVDFAGKIEAIKLAFECKLDGYGYFSASDEDTQESILIGAYALSNAYVPLSEALRLLIESNAEPVDLKRFEAGYLRPRSSAD